MATMTITTTGAEDTRLAAAYGNYLGLAGNANAAQIKASVIASIKAVVFNYETKVAEAAADAGVTPIAPT